MKSKKTFILFMIFCFLAVLIVIGSVLFSIKDVVGYCYNSDDEVVRAQVSNSDIHGIETGMNIFMLNENEVRDAVESKIPNVKVINVERKFPSSVYINYIVLEEYFQIQNGGSRLYVSNDCEILRKEERSDEFDNGHIILYCGAKPSSTEVGSRVFSGNSTRYAVVSELMTAISRLGYYKDIIDVIKLVDLRFIDQNLLYIKTNTGVTIEIINPGNALTTKVQLAMSKLDGCSFEQKSKGTIIVTNQGSKISGAYSTEDRYAEKLQELTTQ